MTFLSKCFGLICDAITGMIFFPSIILILGNPFTLVFQVANNGWNEINSVFHDTTIRAIRYAVLVFGGLFCWLIGAPFMYYDRIARQRNRGIHIFSVGRDDPKITQKEEWIFINGICTDKKMATFNAEYLNKLFGRKITVVYNPSYGTFMDLFECVLGRNFNIFGDEERALTSVIESALNDSTNTKIVLLAHSQGAIIALNCVESLSSTQKNVHLLEVYTFVGASSDAPQHLNIKFEHFQNLGDYVSLLGSFWNDEYNTARHRAFRESRCGHLLNAAYLEPGINPQSTLYQYLLVPKPVPTNGKIPLGRVLWAAGLIGLFCTVLVMIAIGFCIPCILGGFAAVLVDAIWFS